MLVNLNQKGQVVIVLLLTMLVGLGIGLVVTQKSLTDVATSTKTEQASRAFSAAQAGIEKALQTGSSITTPEDLGNQSTATVNVVNNLPRPAQALEYPQVTKDNVGQFWLADPNTLAAYYLQNTVNIYFGNEATTDLPAIEINLVSKDGTGKYVSNRFFYDIDSARYLKNGFILCTTNPLAINTSSSPDAVVADRDFKCSLTLNNIKSFGTPIMIRARILYSNQAQNMAVQPTNASCGTTACALPPQASIYTSTGVSGQTQKTLQVFRAKNIPFFLDYAVFSTGDINK